jgi:hypothetical protein
LADLKKEFITFLGEIKENDFIPDSVANNVAFNMLNLMSRFLLVPNPQKLINELKVICRSTHLQNKFIETNFNYIDCETIQCEESSFQYISIIRTLESSLNNKEIYEELIKEKSKLHFICRIRFY